ncbi:MAG: DUF5995 family protein [Ginsengibacter sp.]
MNLITTIDEVIAQLDEIIGWSLTNKNRVGYFATLYRRMTVAVKQGIVNNDFQDGKRMEQLDVIFATRYFVAWEAYVNEKPCSNGWHAAFDACQNSELIVLQHLLLGINTHINLDLCIAAAECCPGNNIYALQPDFEKINDIIEAQSQLVQDTLCNIWPPLKLFTNISNDQEKAVLNFSIATARKCSWANAIVLANTNDSQKSDHILQIDNMVVELAKQIIDPGIWMEFLLKPVRMMEDPDVGKLIGLLKT